MAINPLSAVSVQMFRDQFTNKFEGTQKLMGTVIEVSEGVVGDAYKWPILGATTMKPRGAYGSIIAPTTLDHTRIVTTFDEFALNIPVDRGEQALVNADERSQLASKHANAAGRRLDQFIIDGMNDATVPASNVIVDAGTNMSFDKLLEIQFLFTKGNVPFEDRFVMMHAAEVQALNKEEELTNYDYNVNRVLNQGRINSFLNMNFIIFGDVEEGGIPKTGDIRTCFAWNRQSVGLVHREKANVEIDWSAERNSWLSISTLAAGSSVLLGEGLIKIGCDETA